ncbi:protein-disulfide reductase DsbD domain-containing protein [Aurantimonas sp. VKM B-3413]|uniref:protein-disulfide reductase DsbD domain-containing protein n=1 Tax=Aurantimonas sp. VKM B-3413 TaxID=2779401 RepID=UPI001E3D9C57|nr:protein-disulfide reductase DsbD domain-containing protein [Aurantimonas sp. VKM B-3413]MCB8839161.1 hypothetical protein [Aurantimonas sp. VKM B-3413]
MTRLLAAAVSLAGLALSASAAIAAAPQSSLVTDQVTVELLREAPSADGSVRGALMIDLAPGWKTYWIDPGAAGIPPTIDFSATKGLEDAELRLPAPHRFGEGFARSNGYDAPLAAAFTLTPRKGETLGPITASVMLGVCHDICIPVQATLTADDANAQTGVESAFSALPKANGEIGTIDPAITAASADALTIRVDVAGKADRPDLFVSAPGGWFFDEPAAPVHDGDSYVFTVPILERPRGEKGAPSAVDAVFTAGDRSIAADSLPVAPGS